MIRTLTVISLSFLMFSCGNAQKQGDQRLVGGPCEGCEAVFEYGDRQLTPTDTLPDFHEDGTRIKVEGTIFKNDGVTPAGDVILYVYHTNQDGIYAPGENSSGWGRQHGYIRGWIKTNSDGHFAIYTLRPAPYPNRTDPAHIHFTILEPDGRYYWLGSCHFKGDSMLTENEINPDKPRGGSTGLLTLEKEGDLLVGNRDIILGLNVPGYK